MSAANHAIQLAGSDLSGSAVRLMGMTIHAVAGHPAISSCRFRNVRFGPSSVFSEANLKPKLLSPEPRGGPIALAGQEERAGQAQRP
jgi:hypothetical protein